MPQRPQELLRKHYGVIATDIIKAHTEPATPGFGHTKSELKMDT
jgi:hypothetical protein